MTDERMALLELIEKQADSDLVREMPAFAADRIMELEVELRTGAAKGSRSPLREARSRGPLAIFFSALSFPPAVSIASNRRSGRLDEC